MVFVSLVGLDFDEAVARSSLLAANNAVGGGGVHAVAVGGWWWLWLLELILVSVVVVFLTLVLIFHYNRSCLFPVPPCPVHSPIGVRQAIYYCLQQTASKGAWFVALDQAKRDYRFRFKMSQEGTVTSYTHADFEMPGAAIVFAVCACHTCLSVCFSTRL